MLNAPAWTTQKNSKSENFCIFSAASGCWPRARSCRPRSWYVCVLIILPLPVVLRVCAFVCAKQAGRNAKSLTMNPSSLWYLNIHFVFVFFLLCVLGRQNSQYQRFWAQAPWISLLKRNQRVQMHVSCLAQRATSWEWQNLSSFDYDSLQKYWDGACRRRSAFVCVSVTVAVFYVTLKRAQCVYASWARSGEGLQPQRRRAPQWSHQTPMVLAGRFVCFAKSKPATTTVAKSFRPASRKLQVKKASRRLEKWLCGRKNVVAGQKKIVKIVFFKVGLGVSARMRMLSGMQVPRHFIEVVVLETKLFVCSNVNVILTL